ncbi:MAG: hypothetical protein V4850_16455 [Myxococcota bacterium]
MEVTDDLGRIGVGEADVMVAGDMKLGAYDVAFVDAEWHSSVTEISLLRSYSTLRKDTVGDFGHGWRLSMLDMRVQRNGPLGDGGWRREACGTGFLYYPVCTVTDEPHLVAVRWPDGTVEAFDLTPDVGSSYFSEVMTVSYTGRPGTTSTIEAIGPSTVVLFGDKLYTSLAATDLYDPRQYWLTDRYNVMYLLDRDEGLLETVDRNGNRVVYSDDGIFPDRGVGVDIVRDSAGRIARMDLADGSSIDYGYDAAGDLVSVTDQVGDVTEFAYDGHRLTTYNDAGHDPVAVLTYDEDGRLVEQVDPMGVLVVTESDLDGFTQTVVGPDPRLVTTSTYDQDGLLAQVVEAFEGEELVYAWEFDADFQVVRTTAPSGAVQAFAYDEAGRVTEAVDADGVTTEWVYDDDGDVLAVYVDGELKGETTYDAAGNALTELSATGEVLFVHTYDTWGGPLTWTDADGGTGEVLYDGADQVRGFVVNGRTAQFGLDAFGRGVSFSDGLGEFGTAVYDARGKVTEFTDASGHVQRWSYDERGFLVSRTDKAARTSTFVYAEDGNILEETTRAGDVLTFEYDDAGRISRVDGGDVWVEYTYDALGRISQVTNAEQGIAFTYDVDGNLVSETVVAAEPDAYPDRTTNYDWTVAGRLTTVANGFGTRSLTYDTHGRIVALDDSVTGATTFDWSADDLLTEVERSTGVRTELDYTPGQRLSGIRTTNDGALVEDQILVRDEDGPRRRRGGAGRRRPSGRWSLRRWRDPCGS